jgi:hypothetical protein
MHTDGVPTITLNDDHPSSSRPALALQIPTEREEEGGLRSGVSREEVVRRASPAIESFEQTAWGEVMKRIDSASSSQHHTDSKDGWF